MATADRDESKLKVSIVKILRMRCAKIMFAVHRVVRIKLV